jgi:hypothetical protein
MITNNSRCTPKIKYNIDIAKLHSNIRNAFQKQIWLDFLEENCKLLHFQQVIFMVLNFAHFRKWIELWCWRWTEELVSFSCVGNEKVLLIGKKESNSLHTTNRRKCNCIGHILVGICLIKHDIGWKERRKFRN